MITATAGHKQTLYISQFYDRAAETQLLNHVETEFAGTSATIARSEGCVLMWQ